MKPQEERWDLLIATYEILYYHKPMPHELRYEDQYILIKLSKDVTPRGFDVVLKDPHETTVMRVKIAPGALLERTGFRFRTEGCGVYLCRQGKWCDYVLRLAAEFKEEFRQAELERRAEVQQAWMQYAERKQQGAEQRDSAEDFAPVDDAELFAD